MPHGEQAGTPTGVFGRWNAIPLYFRILIAMVLGVVAGIVLGERAAFLEIFKALAMFIACSLLDQILVVATSIIASVGAAEIPEAGLVTMTLAFKAVDLPVENTAILPYG